MSERRYSEEEVAEIFERATQAQQFGRRQLPASEGVTLAELQEIGGEVGIPADLVAHAAHSLDRAASPSRKFLGVPIGVGHVVDLRRQLTDDEWEQFVVVLRETFDARGSVRYDGPFRQWTNGNLQALLEPTETGHRIRFRTTNGSARAWMTGGVGLLGLAGAVFTAILVTGRGDAGALMSLVTIGLGMFGVGALRLPSWARLRRRQMEALAERLQIEGHAAPPDDPPAGTA
jgi:hypothetical protein